MSYSQINKLVWIIDTIRRAGKITFEEINSHWIDNKDLSDGQEILKRTFHKWKKNIFDLFGLEIKCDRLSNYSYYISNIDDIEGDSIEKWILSNCSVTNSLLSCHSIREKIILENIPSGEIYLELIIDALYHNKAIEMVYCSYFSNEAKTRIVNPYCLKIFKRRWYLLAKSVSDDKIKTFSLDRIKQLKVLNQFFTYPDDFVPEEYFSNCYGIIVSDDVKAEHIVLKVDAKQANYLRDVPLLSDGCQVETERNDKYSIFELDVCPTFDFKQELLTHMNYLEVIQPQLL